MSLLKIQVEKTVIEKSEIEVELPCYTKNGFNFYSVKDHTNAVSIWIHADNAVLSTSMAKSAFDKGFEYITKEDFEHEFDKAITNIHSKKA